MYRIVMCVCVCVCVVLYSECLYCIGYSVIHHFNVLFSLRYPWQKYFAVFMITVGISASTIASAQQLVCVTYNTTGHLCNIIPLYIIIVAVCCVVH